jgi:hypothetical protein
MEILWIGRKEGGAEAFYIEGLGERYYSVGRILDFEF